MGFIVMLSREAGTIAYGTRMIEQDRINLSVQVDLGNCTQVAYTPTTTVTALTASVIWFENNFYIPDGVTTFTFTDGTTDMEATLDGTWSFTEVATSTEVAYTASGSITEISDGVTYDSGNFTVPLAVTEFDFRDDGYQKTGLYDSGGDTWEWLHWLASTDGNTAQSWVFRLPTGVETNWHMGDGTVQAITGLGLFGADAITLTHTYTEPAGEGETYDIKVSGDISGMTRLDCNNMGLTGEANQFSVISDLQYMYINANNFSGSSSKFNELTSMVYMSGFSNPNLELNIGEFSTWVNCTTLLLNNSLGVPGRITGDASTLITLPSNVNLNLSFNSINGITFNSQAFWNNDGATINLSYCNLSSTDVDNALIAFAGDGTTHVKNSTITLGNNATRTSASDAAVASINDVARGNTLDIT